MSSTRDEKPIYRIIFTSGDAIHDVYAKAIYESELYGFIEIEEFIFANKNNIIVNVEEERTKQMFKNVIRSFIPLHAIVRMDEILEQDIERNNTGCNKTVRISRTGLIKNS